GKETSRIKLPTGFVLKIAWSRDGKYLAAGSHDGTVYLWGRSIRAVPVETKVVPNKKFDRFDQLVDDLAQSKRSPDACVDALFLAALGRFPQETERKFCSDHINKTADRREALKDVLFQLTNTREFQEHITALQGQQPRLQPR